MTTKRKDTDGPCQSPGRVVVPDGHGGYREAGELDRRLFTLKQLWVSAGYSGPSAEAVASVTDKYEREMAARPAPETVVS